MNKKFYTYIDYLHFELGLTAEDINAIPLSGRADNEVEEIAKKDYIQKQFAYFSYDTLYNAVNKLYDEPNLKNRQECIEYIVWGAACDIQEMDEEFINYMEKRK